MSEYMKRQIEEQNEDMTTFQERKDLIILLTDKEYSNLKLMAYNAGLDSAGALLSSFVSDLTGWHSKGSDEREIARNWYDRAFGMSEYYSNFRYHLFNYDYGIEDMVELIEDEDFFNEVYQQYIAENDHKTNESKEECLSTLKDIVAKGKEL